MADIFDALAAKRPYRDAMPIEKAFQIMQKDAPHALDASCLEALEQSGAVCDQTYVDLQTLNLQLLKYAKVSSEVTVQPCELIQT